MTNSIEFSDIQRHWARECIQQLANRRIVSGYPNGQFRPELSLSRAEFAAILQRAFPNVPPVRPPATFVDVAPSFWAAAAIQAAYRAGFLSGYPGRVFRPQQPMPRVQVLVALVSGLRYGVEQTPPAQLSRYFDDASQIPTYATDAIAAAVRNYLIVNYPNLRQLQPNQQAARGEVAATVCRALRLPGVPLEFVVGFNFAVPPQFVEASPFAGGLARVKIGDRWGYINMQGQPIIEPQFDDATSFSDGLALVRLKTTHPTHL